MYLLCKRFLIHYTRASAGGVAPFYGRKLRSGVAAPAAVPQLQDSQPHKGALART